MGSFLKQSQGQGPLEASVKGVPIRAAVAIVTSDPSSQWFAALCRIQHGQTNHSRDSSVQGQLSLTILVWSWRVAGRFLRCIGSSVKDTQPRQARKRKDGTVFWMELNEWAENHQVPPQNVDTNTNGKYCCWLLSSNSRKWLPCTFHNLSSITTRLAYALICPKTEGMVNKKHRCTCPTLSRYPFYLLYAGTIWPSQVVRTPKIHLYHSSVLLEPCQHHQR